jgi:metallophosphoesterase (TIGR00282 family)
VKLLFIGDIVGRPGRNAVRGLLPSLEARWSGLDLVIANAENAAGGVGLTEALAKEITGYGVDWMTTGNHVWDQKEFVAQIECVPNVLRPVNLPSGTPGRGAVLAHARNGDRVAIVNLGGRLFFHEYENPFEAADRILPPLREETPIVVVDFHAEATSEKIAMGRFLDGRASLVVGTHTHVQTADETIFPGGTAYITDVGMTGPHDSVIGVQVERVVRKFRTQMPEKFECATGDPRLSAVFVEIESDTGRARRIERLCIPLASPDQ